MVVNYPRTVWKNSYAEHKVTGKTYNYTNIYKLGKATVKVKSCDTNNIGIDTHIKTYKSQYVPIKRGAFLKGT